MRRFRKVVSLGVLCAAAGWAAGTGADEAGLAARIDAALLRLGPHASAGVRVVSLARGDVLYERNPDLSMNPASNMKLLTSCTALAKLGPEYQFTTRVLSTAALPKPKELGPAAGTLDGDLILQGGGDPVLETPDLVKLADAVREAGVRSVTGALRVDDYRFDTRRLGAGWPSGDEPYYYSAQISALSLDRNVQTVEVTPGATEGAPAEVKLLPVEGYLTLLERPRTTATGETQIDVERTRAKNEVHVTGTIPLGAKLLRDTVTMEEPELYAGAVFRKLLLDRGIHIAGATRREAAPATAVEVANHVSPPLSRIVALLNKPSDNLVAEMLLKEIGYTQKKAGDAFSGGSVVGGYLKDLGIDTTGVKVNDGSGLSRLDLVTARVISDLLVKVDAQPWNEVLRTSLPIAGVDGTLRLRLKGTAAEKNVTAKTGSLSHVSALGGYVTDKGGERLAFSILINNHPGPTSGANAPKRIEDAIAVALAESQRGVK